MTAPTSPSTRRRTIALWLSGVAVVLIAIPLVMLLVVALTAGGENALAGVWPLFLLMFGSWIPVVLAIVGLIVSRGADRPMLPVVLAIVAIVASIVGVILAFALII